MTAADAEPPELTPAQRRARAQRANAARAARQAEGGPGQRPEGAPPPRAAGGPGPAARKAAAQPQPLPPVAGPAQARPRHWGILLLALLLIALPTGLSGWYLWNRAADQYESQTGFAIRAEEVANPFEILGALGVSTGPGGKDADILAEYIQSQQLVSLIDSQLDLRGMFAKPAQDPIFGFHPDGTIEDLTDYWKRMVVLDYDSSTGLIALRVFAFDPADAQAIARAVLDESSKLINALSAAAREDTTQFSKDSLDQAMTRLAASRAAITEFRVRNQIVDPTADVASQMGLLTTLNQQLAEALIEYDLLQGATADSDPRLTTAKRRIEVTEARIRDERAKMGVGGAEPGGIAEIVGEYERLKIDLEFNEKTYLAALASYDSAKSEADRKSRYLAVYADPTLAQAPTAPSRPLLLVMILALGFLTWSILVLIYYALRDRR